MAKKLKWIKTFEDIQSIAVSGMYDTGASGSFGRWKNENPALELEDIIKKDENILDILDAIIIGLSPLKENGLAIDIRKAFGRKDMVITEFILPEKYFSDIRIKYINIIKNLLLDTYPEKSNIVLSLEYKASFDIETNTLRLTIKIPKK